MTETTVFILHRKSANEPYVKAAVKTVRKEGYDLRVLVPFSKSEKPRILHEALERGATRIIVGGGDGTINAIANLSPYEGRVVIPGEGTIEGSMLFAAVANNHFAGGGFDVAPLSKIDDGLLDLVAIRSDRGVQLTKINKELEDPMNPNNVHVTYRQLAEFTIESDQKLHCNLDGEPVKKKKLRFSIRPRHLRVAF